MIANILKLCGWLFYTLVAAVVFFGVCLADASRLYSGAPGFYWTVCVSVGYLGLLAMSCFLLGKLCFMLSRRFAKEVR